MARTVKNNARAHSSLGGGGSSALRAPSPVLLVLQTGTRAPHQPERGSYLGQPITLVLPILQRVVRNREGTKNGLLVGQPNAGLDQALGLAKGQDLAAGGSVRKTVYNEYNKQFTSKFKSEPRAK